MGIVDEIKEKLKKYSIADYDELNNKEKERLYKIQEFIHKNTVRYEQLQDELKNLRLTKVQIANAKEIGLSRKTLYNDKVVQKFIEVSIQGQNYNIKNEKLYDLQNKYNELKEQYTKIISNLIETNLLYEKIDRYEETISALTKQNENLKSIIYRNNIK
nr:hypothetical protein [uncultured Clostridium sp.]